MMETWLEALVSKDPFVYAGGLSVLMPLCMMETLVYAGGLCGDGALDVCWRPLCVLEGWVCCGCLGV